MRVNVERFSIPEILFQPSIIGIEQAGIAESIWNSVEQIPERLFIFVVRQSNQMRPLVLDIRPSLYNNILLIGGNCRFPNFKERLSVK